MRFQDIPKFTPDGSYQVDIPLAFLERSLGSYDEAYGLHLNPDFQRGNVWSEEQQIKWLEFFFRGGRSANVIYFNCPDFSAHKEHKSELCDIQGMYCVDGLQRLTAMRRFLKNEIPIFGTYCNEFEDSNALYSFSLKFNVNCLQTRKDMLQWYIDMNSGGTVHSEEEINRVKKLLTACDKQPPKSKNEPTR